MRYKNCIILIAVLATSLCCNYHGYAQTAPPIFFKVTMLPPYSAYLTDYSNNYMVTITNTSGAAVDIFLKASLANDHGQSAQSKSNIYSQPVHVDIRQTVTLMGNQIDPNLFSVAKIDNNFDFKTIGNIRRDAQLPEGVYTFCITPFVFDSRRGTYTPIPINPPGGNCATFVISTAKPPIITNPVSEQKVIPNQANSVNIAWIRPTGVTGRASITYTLYVAKVNPGEDPNQVIANVVEYGAGYFYKVPDLVQPVYQLNDLQPFHLEEGARYAILVQATDNTHTLAIENNGRSEVVSFVYEAKIPDAQTKPTQKPKPDVAAVPVIYPSEGNDFGTSTVTGNLNYYFSPDNFAPGTALSLSHVPIRLVKEYFIYYQEAGVNMSLTSNSLQVFSEGYDYGNDINFDFLNSHKVKEVAYTTTDVNGNFVFTFPSSEKTNDDYGEVVVEGMPDFIKDPTNGKYIPKFGKSVSAYDPNTGKTTFVNIPSNNTASERLLSAMSIEILNPYYYGPLIEVPDLKYNSKNSNLSVYFDDTLQNKNLGQLNAYVGDFNFHVHINLDVQNNGYDKPADHSKFNVFVLRKKTSGSASNIINGAQDIPISESESYYSTALPPGETQNHYDKKTYPVEIPNTIKNSPYEVVAYGATDVSGYCDFTRLRCFSGDPMYYFYAVADAENDLNYSMSQILSLQDLINIKAINFNDNNPTRSLSLNLEPAPGKIWGYVRRNDSKYSIKDAQVSLLLNASPNNQVNTDNNGYYQFTPFSTGTKSFTLNAAKAGYLDDNVSFTGSLLPGQKIHTDLFIDTIASVFGKIVDKNGDGVDAYVSIENGASVHTGDGGYYTDPQGYDHYSPATFKIGCPKGLQKLIIDPTDNHFAQKIILVDVKQSLIDKGTIVLDGKERHIKFVVLQYESPLNASIPQYDEAGNYIPPVKKLIPNAKISVSIQGFTGITNQNGEIDFDLANDNALNLTVKTQGPELSNYIPNTTTVAIPSSGSSKIIYLYLKQGCQVQGFVNYNGKEVPGATVIFKNGTPANWLTTTTDANGYYELHGVPAGNGLTFVAGKQEYIGDEKKGNPSLLNHFTVDFNLTKNGNVDFTQMLGFKMVVTKYDPANHLLSGYFHQLPNNNDFKVLEDTIIPFSNINVTTVLQGEYKYFYPASMPLKTDLNRMELSAKGYNVRIQLADPNGVSIIGKNTSISYGTISGKAKVDIAAIQDATDLLFSDELFLRSSSSAMLPDNVSTITSDGKPPYSTDLYLSNASGKDINFTYQGFSVTASHLTSAITDNNLCHLAGTLNAHIITDDNVMQKISIPISKFDFTDHNGVNNYQQQSSFEIPIQQWKVVGDQYTFGSEGLHIKKGHIQTTQVNVPFTDLVLKHNPVNSVDELKYGNYQLQHLDLAGVADLMLEPSAAPQFYYDPNQKLWQLIVAGPANSKVGTIQGLTPLNKNLTISEFALNSKNKNGHLQLSDDSKTVNIYNGLANYTISYLDVSPDDHLINLSDGILDLGIPQLSYPKNNTLSFYKKNGQVGVNVNPFSLSGYVQGVNLSFPVLKEAFQPSGFTVAGSLSESGKNPYQLNVLLKHLSGSNYISIDPNSNKSLFIDKEKTKSISNLNGSMQTIANNTQWSKFKFEGDLTGCVNVSSHLHFTINGDIGIDPGQKVAVASMNPGGESVSSMQFDFTTGELRATINIPKEDLGGGISFGGGATMVVNKSGWFFAGNGNATFPNPIIDGAGTIILFGNYPNAGQDNDIAKAFGQSYFYKKNNSLPPNYQKQLNGFLIDAQISKDIIPPTSISWGTGDLDVGFNAHADLYLGAQFTPVKTLDIGGLVGAEADMSASQSLGVVCISGAASAFIDSYFTGSVNTNGQYCLTVGGDFGVQGKLEIKVGGCSASCNDLLGVTPCVDIVPPLGAGVTLSLSYTLGNLNGCNTGISAALK